MENQKQENIYLNLASNRENYMTAFRENIVYLKKKKGWSVRILAEKAGMSEDTLNTFLKSAGKDCNLSTAVKLARALDVSIDELVGAETSAKETRDCIAYCRVMPPHFVYLIRSYIGHIYKLFCKTGKEEFPIIVIMPECRSGHLQTTNVTSSINISHLDRDIRAKVAHGLKIPCDHYEPYFMPGEIILLAVDRDGKDGEICVISHDGNYYIVRKKQYILNGTKRWKYISLFTDREFLKEEIDDKLGYVVGWLNEDLSCGVR